MKNFCFMVLSVLISVIPCYAGTVIFADGKALQIERHEFREDRVILTMQGGGIVEFDAARILEVRLIDPATGEVLIDVPESVKPTSDCGTMIEEIAQKHSVDSTLVRAIIKVESNFNPKAVSPKGAQGIMQLMPHTAERFNVKDVFDPEENIEGGIKYLKFLMERYGNRYDLILAAYNAGEEAVDRYGGVPPYRETIDYVLKVLKLYNKS